MDTGPAAKEGAAGPVAVQADRTGAEAVPTLLAGLRRDKVKYSWCL